MSHLYSNCPPYWNSHDQQISDSLSKSLTLNMGSSPQVRKNARSLGFHLQDHESSSSQSTQSNHDLTATAGTNSQDQCLSSESGREVSGGKTVGQVKPVYVMGHPDASFNATHVDYSCTMTCMPYPCGDPYFNGLMTPYGPAPAIQPQVMGVTTTRVPLPLDFSEDEPIYVNAKQYNGILRRRQSRAKLEAQNKLIKARKPYLHESRHLHALNRVRGSGGRFLSTKKLQQSESNPANGNHSNRGSNSFDHDNGISLGFETHYQPQCTSVTSSSSGDGSYFQHANAGFLGISSGVARQQNGGFMNRQNQHCASVVQ